MQIGLTLVAMVAMSLAPVPSVSADDLPRSMVQNSPDQNLAASLDELCKLSTTLATFQATIVSTRRQIVVERDAAAARYAEATAALEACLPRPECKASDGDRLATNVETIFEQRYAYDRMLKALDVRLSEQSESGKRLDLMIQGKCPAEKSGAGTAQ